MIRSLLNFLAFNAFVLLLPLFCFAAWRWGSSDEQWLMKVASCALGPFCAAIWYILLSRPALGRKPGYAMPFLIIVLGYAGIISLLKFRIVGF
jgi:hypothetical protein